MTSIIAASVGTGGASICVDIEEIIHYILENFEGVTSQEAFGEASFFYNPGMALPSGIYFMSIKEKDSPGDMASNLNRTAVYRLDVGASKETFVRMFGSVPRRPPKGGVIQGDYDFTKMDTIMPHPVYGWAYWICVLNPSQDTFEKTKPIIQECYRMLKERFQKRDKGSAD